MKGCGKVGVGGLPVLNIYARGKAGRMAMLARILNLKFWPEYMYGIPPAWCPLQFLSTFLISG